MIKNLLNMLHREKKAEQEEPRWKLGNGYYWEFDQIPNGYGGYKTVNAYLLKQGDPGFKRLIVDGSGEIQNFPGFEDESWKAALEMPFDHKVRFAFWISPFADGKASVRWTIQPDGRYFADEDGFGAEKCTEIEVHSWLDENGKFTAPFFCKREFGPKRQPDPRQA